MDLLLTLVSCLNVNSYLWPGIKLRSWYLMWLCNNCGIKKIVFGSIEYSHACSRALLNFLWRVTVQNTFKNNLEKFFWSFLGQKVAIWLRNWFFGLFWLKMTYFDPKNHYFWLLVVKILPQNWSKIKLGSDLSHF